MSQDNERCWICLVDKIDDPTSEWSQPCKCSLIAHKEVSWLIDIDKFIISYEIISVY